ncbi:MAG: glycosyltransferase family 4 protein [Chitinophagaceae bacterium]
MDKKIKVLYINQPAGGGTLHALIELLKNINQDLIEPSVICYCKNEFTKKLEEIPGCKVYYLDINGKTPAFNQQKKVKGKLFKIVYSELTYFKRYFIHDRPKVNAIYRLIQQINPGIIHHNCGLHADRSSIRAACKAGVPQVLHTRGNWSYYKGINFYLYKRQKKCIAAWIFLTAGECKKYEQLFHLSPQSLFVLNDFVDRSVFKPFMPGENIKTSFDIKNNDFVIANLGRIIPWKGQHVLIEAMHLLKNLPVQFKILMVGSFEKGIGSETYLEELKELVRKYGLEKQVVFAGNRNDIPAIINVSDLIVHTAVKPEPQGLVIIEALFCQKKVIASNAGGAAELIQKYGGYLTPPGDAKALAEKIKSIIQEKITYDFPLNFAQLEEDFNGAKQMDQLMEVYRYALSKN